MIFEDIPRINCPSSQLTQKCLTLDLRRLMMTEPFLSMPYLGSLASCLSTRPADIHHYLVLSRRRSVIREHIDHSGILSDTEAWQRYDIRDCMTSSSERMSSFFEFRYLSLRRNTLTVLQAEEILQHMSLYCPTVRPVDRHLRESLTTQIVPESQPASRLPYQVLRFPERIQPRISKSSENPSGTAILIPSLDSKRKVAEVV